MLSVRNRIILGVLVLATVALLFLLPPHGGALRFAWRAETQDRFRKFGEAVLLNAAAQDGNLGPSFNEWIREGLIRQEQVSFRDERQDMTIQVLRTLRPIPNTSYPDTLILLVETYEPPLGYVNVLGLDGRAYEVREENIEEIFGRDNTQRIESGLEELEIPRVR